MKHKLIMSKWVNGILRKEKKIVHSLMEALEHAKRYVGYAKIYDEEDIIVFSSEDKDLETYA